MCYDFKCRECKEGFDEPREEVDWSEAWGHMVPMYSHYCPHCGSEAYAEFDKVEREEENATQFAVVLIDGEEWDIEVPCSVETEEEVIEIATEDFDGEFNSIKVVRVPSWEDR